MTHSHFSFLILLSLFLLPSLAVSQILDGDPYADLVRPNNSTTSFFCSSDFNKAYTINQTGIGTAFLIDVEFQTELSTPECTVHAAIQAESLAGGLKVAMNYKESSGPEVDLSVGQTILLGWTETSGPAVWNLSLCIRPVDGHSSSCPSEYELIIEARSLSGFALFMAYPLMVVILVVFIVVGALCLPMIILTCVCGIVCNGMQKSEGCGGCCDPDGKFLECCVVGGPVVVVLLGLVSAGVCLAATSMMVVFVVWVVMYISKWN